MINHGIQALSLEIRKKMKNHTYHYVVTMSTEEYRIYTGNCHVQLETLLYKRETK